MSSSAAVLRDVYCHLSDAEHGWNYTHIMLDITHEVDICTHGIVHLEPHVET
jgi:hypothetical protein